MPEDPQERFLSATFLVASRVAGETGGAQSWKVMLYNAEGFEVGGFGPFDFIGSWQPDGLDAFGPALNREGLAYYPDPGSIAAEDRWAANVGRLPDYLR